MEEDYIIPEEGDKVIYTKQSGDPDWAPATAEVNVIDVDEEKGTACLELPDERVLFDVPLTAVSRP